MKKIFVGLAAFVSTLALVLPAIAASPSADGYVQQNGNNVIGAGVYITNLTTGARGSTVSKANGYFLFGGITFGNRYQVYSGACISHRGFNSQTVTGTAGDNTADQDWYVGVLRLVANGRTC